MSSSGAPGRPPGIVTPDAVGLDLPVATVGSRGAAYLLDLLLFGTVLALLMISQALLGASGFVPGWFGIALLLLLAFTWQFGYPIAFEVLAHGRTPGKMALGLRVVTVEGAPVGIRHAVIRAAVAVLELLGTSGAIAVISSFASPRSQRLGDMAAGTLVVRERRRSGAPAAEQFAPPVGYEAYVARLDVSGLGASEYAAVRATLQRAGELAPVAREAITTGLAAQLVSRVRPPPPAECSATEFLTCVAAAVQARRARSLSAPGVQAHPSPGVTAWGTPPSGVQPSGGRPSGVEPPGVEPSGVEPSGVEPSGPPSTPPSSDERASDPAVPGPRPPASGFSPPA